MELRLHHTPAKRIVKTRSYPQKLDYKPEGLWYGIDLAWREWCSGEMPKWNRRNKNHFSIEFKPRQINKILFLDSIEKIEAFIDKYGGYPSWMTDSFSKSRYATELFRTKHVYIHWEKVAADYGGIEISPYQHTLRHRYLFYYGWDIASGCIWNLSLIKKITKINKPKQTIKKQQTLCH